MTTAPMKSQPIESPVTGSARFERKYYIQPYKFNWVKHLLSHACVKDPQYPMSQVHSIYYDTPHLDCLTHSDEGDYERKKIRVRWYDQPWQHSDTATVYVELKHKQGFTGTKTRQAFSVPSKLLKTPQPLCPVIDQSRLHDTLCRFNAPHPLKWEPVALISYERIRFIDRMTDLRVSLDWHISSTLINPRHRHQESQVTLSGAVLEIKGPSMTLPRTLHSLVRVGTDWTRFSKYAGCLTCHFEPFGSMGRFSPSGRVSSM